MHENKALAYPSCDMWLERIWELANVFFRGATYFFIARLTSRWNRHKLFFIIYTGYLQNNKNMFYRSLIPTHGHWELSVEIFSQLFFTDLDFLISKQQSVDLQSTGGWAAVFLWFCAGPSCGQRGDVFRLSIPFFYWGNVFKFRLKNELITFGVSTIL